MPDAGAADLATGEDPALMPRLPPAAPRTDHGFSMPVLNGAPWYVKVVIWLLVWFGFPVAMVIVLFMVFLGQLPSPITDTNKRVQEIQKDMATLARYTEVTTRMMRQMCRNTSTHAAERVTCDQ